MSNLEKITELNSSFHDRDFHSLELYKERLKEMQEIIEALEEETDELYYQLKRFDANKCFDAEDACIKLPLDANGTPINIGDKVRLESIDTDGVEVIGITSEELFFEDTDGIKKEFAHTVLRIDPIEGLLEMFWRQTDGIMFPSDKDALLNKMKSQFAQHIRTAIKNS